MLLKLNGVRNLVGKRFGLSAIVGLWFCSTSHAFDAGFEYEISGNQITVNWDRVQDAENYILEYATSPELFGDGNENKIETLGTSTTLQFLDYRETYYFQLHVSVNGELQAADTKGVSSVSRDSPQVIEWVGSDLGFYWSNISEEAVAVGPNGRYVAFSARDTAPGFNQVYVFDRILKKSTLITQRSDGTVGNGNSFHPRFTTDGSFIYFISDATNLAGNTQARQSLLYRYEVDIGDIQLVTRAVGEPGSLPMEGVVLDYDVNADGSSVVFSAHSVRNVPAGRAAAGGMYLLDVEQNEYQLIQVTNEVNSEEDINVGSPRMSSDSRYLGFRTKDIEWLNVTFNTEYDEVAFQGRFAGVFYDSNLDIFRFGTQDQFERGARLGVESLDIGENGNVFWITTGSNANTHFMYRYRFGRNVSEQIFVDDADVRSNGTRIDEIYTDDSGTIVSFPEIRRDAESGPSSLLATFSRDTNRIEGTGYLSSGEPFESDEFSHQISADGNWVGFLSDAEQTPALNEQDNFFVTVSDRSDSDDDGVVDVQDELPLDATGWQDTDGDGIANAIDTDSDNDGISDEIEQELGLNPLNVYDAAHDIDGDGLSALEEVEKGSDILLLDTDSDGTPDSEDAFPNDSSESQDTDGDGIGDNSDLDVDGDNIFDAVDCDPSDATNASRCPRTTLDFNGDNISDFAVRNVASLTQQLFVSGEDELQEIVFGTDSADIPLTGDFDSDGISDIAIRRASELSWFVRNSSGIDGITDNQDGITRIRFGLRAEDIPVPADYDGDGITDIAVRRPSNRTWYIRNSSGQDPISGNSDGISRVRFGLQREDIPVVADYDGDGRADIAVRRASSQFWYIRNSSGTDAITGNTDGITRLRFGRQEQDIPVPADYDSDGIADLAFFRRANSTWYVLNSSKTNFNSEREDGVQRVRFAGPEDSVPAVADYDGDGIADFSFYEPGNGAFYVMNSRDKQINTIVIGAEGINIPLAAPINNKLDLLQE